MDIPFVEVNVGGNRAQRFNGSRQLASTHRVFGPARVTSVVPLTLRRSLS